MTDGFALNTFTGIAALLVMLFCGRAFRENWKAQKTGWVQRAWAYGVPAVLAFAALAFIPFRPG